MPAAEQFNVFFIATTLRNEFIIINMCDIADEYFSEKFTTIKQCDSDCDVKYVVLLNLNYRYVV